LLTERMNCMKYAKPAAQMKSEIEQVVEESSRKLLQVSIPPVKYWLLSGVLRRSPDDRALQQAIKECEAYPPRLRLLSKLGRMEPGR